MIQSCREVSDRTTIARATSNAQEPAPLHEPIAIIGVGCRFPGGADSPETFWRLLCKGVDAIAEIPADRFDLEKYYDAHPATPGKVCSRWGGFLPNLDKFDAGFFGIAPREAECLDPQQRLLLETGWEALEDAGQAPEKLAANQTGVFIGIMFNDFEDRLSANPDQIDFYMLTGGGRYTASGRLSHLLGLQGPSLTVDTACSSSLVAVHLACQSLRTGECVLALAGGANTIWRPHVSIAFSQAQMLSPEGRCKFGDATANGFVRSEGAGIVVLKRLSTALVDHDPIYAVILGSAVNNDGRSSGSLGTPGAAGQEDMLRKAYRNARVSPGKVHYVEAHGTGTRAGDPVELQALGQVLGADRTQHKHLLVGSVKTNFGHTEGAAGVAGLIKAVLCLKHRAIPASLHFQTPNSKIPWDKLPIIIPTALQDLPDEDEPLIAGVSSFGISGTNAHVVLQEWESGRVGEWVTEVSPTHPLSRSNNLLLPISARTPEALQAFTRSYQNLLQRDASISLRDLCYTASVRRTHHENRLAVVASNRKELVEKLESFLMGEKFPGLINGCKKFEVTPKIVFVFPGQGSQWPGMARQLLKKEPAFRESMQRCEKALQQYADWSLLNQLGLEEKSPNYRLHQIDVIQPTLFSIQVSLAALWRAWGIAPEAVVGHSMGEVAAAHVAGALSLNDAARLICRRSKLLRRTSGQGAMAMVELTMTEAEKAIKDYEDKLSIAVSNSSRSTVLSGDPAALEEIMARLEKKEIFCRRIKVDVASHSPQMDPLREDLLQTLQGLQPQAAAVPIYSTVTGDIIEGEQLNAQYWVDNLRQPVRFSTTIRRLHTDSHDIFIEISAHPLLLASIQEELQAFDQNVTTLASLRREEDEQLVMLESLGVLYVQSFPIAWERLYPEPGVCMKLPAYPWQRERFWPEEQRVEGSGQEAKSEERKAKSEERAPVPSPFPPRSSTQLRDLLHCIEWRPAKHAVVTEPCTATKISRWLIFADRHGIGESMADVLAARGDKVFIVTPGTSFKPDQGGHYEVNPNCVGDFQHLFAEVIAAEPYALHGLIHLWSLNADAASENSLTAITSAQELGCGSALSLVQALIREHLTGKTRLWLLTRGVQVIPEAPADLAVEQSPLWGLGAVIANEHPELHCTRLDLGAAGASEIRSLCEELLSPTPEDQITLRGEKRYVPRLMPWLPQKDKKLPEHQRFHADATYLITGGLGGLGLTFARWMVEQGVRHLVLTGRSNASAEAQNTLDALKQIGAQIVVAQTDVGQAESVAKLLAEIRTSMPPLKGIIHAAGILADSTLAQMDNERFYAALRPKVNGAWNLHAQTLAEPLDFFVLFSSVAALLGTTGQSNYAAGNAFLDALTHYRRTLGKPAVSINWGSWSQVGLAAAQNNRGDRLEARGLGSITPEQGLAAMALLLQEQPAQAVFMSLDLARWRQFHPAAARASLFADFTGAGNDETKSSKKAHAEKVDLRAQLLAVDSGQRRALLEAHLQEQLSQVLKLKPDRMPLNKPLRTLGLDSLMALELRLRLEVSLGLALPTATFFNYPTIALLAPHLAEKMEIPLGEPIAAAPKEMKPQ